MLPILLAGAADPVIDPPPNPDIPIDPLASDPAATLYAIPSGAPYNAPMRTVTPTYDGSGDAAHPSVIDMHREVGGNWHGWRYWMAMTPYHNNNQSIENPSILVSNNGFYWQPPPGIARTPLYWPQGGQELSDTHLVYEPDRDGLLLLYRDNGLNWAHLLARSPDGITWPAEPTFLQFEREQQNLSPSIVRLAADDWRMWGIYRDARSLQMWRASDPFGQWEGPFQCTGVVQSLWAWHLDVQWDGTVFRALIDRGAPISPEGYMAATSTDGIVWKLAGSNFMMNGTGYPNGAWDSRMLYRACHTYHENGTHARVFYSANKYEADGATRRWGTGYTHVPLSEWPAAPAVVAGSGTAYRDAVLADSPAVFWRLSEQYDETVAADASGNGRTGTWEGGHGRATGMVPDADYASAVTNATVSRARESWADTDTYTAEGIYQGYPSAGTIVGVDSTGARGWYLAKQGNTLRWESVHDGLSLTKTNVPGGPAHVAVTVGGGTVTLYLNGVSVATLAATPTAPPAGAALTACKGPFGAFVGVLDEVAVYPTALSAARILAHATAAGLA